jgi:hypothetical protein
MVQTSPLLCKSHHRTLHVPNQARIPLLFNNGSPSALTLPLPWILGSSKALAVSDIVLTATLLQKRVEIGQQFIEKAVPEQVVRTIFYYGHISHLPEKKLLRFMVLYVIFKIEMHLNIFNSTFIGFCQNLFRFLSESPMVRRIKTIRTLTFLGFRLFDPFEIISGIQLKQQVLRHLTERGGGTSCCLILLDGFREQPKKLRSFSVHVLQAGKSNPHLGRIAQFILIWSQIKKLDLAVFLWFQLARNINRIHKNRNKGKTLYNGFKSNVDWER